jgi:hypothetical protein
LISIILDFNKDVIVIKKFSPEQLIYNGLQ